MYVLVSFFLFSDVITRMFYKPYTQFLHERVSDPTVGSAPRGCGVRDEALWAPGTARERVCRVVFYGK